VRYWLKTIYVVVFIKGVGRKIFREATEKNKTKNSTIKSPSTLSVSCMKIQEGHGPSLPSLMVSISTRQAIKPLDSVLVDSFAKHDKNKIV